MAVSYTLGKDATVTGITGEIRSVTATIEGSQIDVTKRGDTQRQYQPGFRDASIELEMLSEPPTAGSDVTISHANSGIGGVFVVTSVARNEPLDDVVSYSVTCKMKQAPTS